MEQAIYSFEVGQPVFLYSAQGDTKQEHLAKIIQVSDSEINLDLSESRRESARTDRQFQCQTGESLQLRSWDEEALYSFEVKVAKISKDNQLLSISRTKPGMTLQRRRQLRTDLRVPFSFTVIDATQVQLVTDEILKAKTENLSLSGLRFESALLLKEGDEILVMLPIIPLSGLNASGTVIWTQRKSGTAHLSIGVRFRQLMPEEQDQILQFMESVKS